MRIGRNEPCPCGSGKKYKKCCLLKEREADHLEAARWEGVRTVASWLAEHYEEAVWAELDESYFGLFGKGLINDVGQFPPDVGEAVWNNAWEWLVADGRLVVDGRSCSPLSLIYDPAGPALTPEQLRWLERTAARRLGLYRVSRIEPGTGAWLEDGMEEEGEPLKVVGAAAQRLRPDTYLGARLVPADGEWEMTGAVYELEMGEEKLVEVLTEEALAKIEDPAAKPRAVGEAIISAWLGSLVEEYILDEPDLHVHDVYRVLDWDRLEAALARESDVEGDRTHGWSRLEDGADERFVIQALNPLPEDRLLVFFSIKAIAEEEADWLDLVAPGAVVLENRREFDPGEVPEPSEELGEVPPDATPKELMAWTQRYLEEIYKGWEHDPVPLFDGKSPALMVRSEEGKARVAALIREFEAAEKREAAEEEREPVSFQFLWKSVGLDGELWVEAEDPVAISSRPPSSPPFKSGARVHSKIDGGRT